MNIDASPSSWHSPPCAPGFEPSVGDGGITEGCEDVYADEKADEIRAESEVSIGNVIWDCRIMVAISAGSGRSVCVGINNDGPSSDNDIALDGD